MKIPTIEFLNTVEKLYTVQYPVQFKSFCTENKKRKVLFTNPVPPESHFICDIDTLKSINTRIGKGEWGDYEQAIIGKTHPKDGNRLWGEILPFFYDESCVFGFDYRKQSGDEVYVWSVHRIVHVYLSFSTWLNNY
ncbi:MAG: hypothetical protein HY753_07285 [Nitrospirae bacterium]|nr:hypothetical protein [Nitrospirota bacterium]